MISEDEADTDNKKTETKVLEAREPTFTICLQRSIQSNDGSQSFDDWSRPQFYSNPRSTMDKMISRLYLGNDMVSQDLALLTENKITHILNLTTNVPNRFEHITYKKIIMLDIASQNIRQYFDESFEFIDESLKDESNSVLVHCNAGVSRSASFVIAYLMQKRLFRNYSDALHYVRKRRPVVNPNYGFEKQLIRLEKKFKKKGCPVM